MKEQFANALTDDQRAVYDAITAGPRARGPQHFVLQNPDGTLNGPFGLMVGYPEVGGPLQALGAALRYRTALSDRERELAILTVAYATGSQFEQTAHEAVARTCGLDDDVLDALRNGTPPPDEREQAIVELARHLTHTAEPTAQATTTAATQLDQRTIYEVTVLTGYYRLLAHTMALLPPTP
ncbi:carboxymuconolactone decarboxylase family protein [Amycolatopsis jejuensis]|uniref:carboxymuconolactone decarboxylase family protein n=1 Tax=Amycolatopsis jejuensis TaxID=330084 RepID=UPI000527DACE|nr:carboxymuconolactone decarboxylase family protein [Amycolatopsis jejuensis]